MSANLLFSILLRGGGGTGAGSGDMTKAVYDPTNIASDAFKTVNHYDTVSVININTNLVKRRMYQSDAVGNLVHALPAATAGALVIMSKAPSTGQVRMNCDGADTFEDGSSTYIECTDSGAAFIAFYCFQAGVWDILGGVRNLWSYA